MAKTAKKKTSKRASGKDANPPKIYPRLDRIDNRTIHAKKKSPSKIYKPVDKENSYARKVQRGEIIPERNEGGRPTLYNDTFAFQFLKYIAKGHTISETAKILGVCLATIYHWRDTQPGFLEAWQKAKQLADQRVVDALFKRATGFKHPAIKLFYNSERNEVVSETYDEYYPPDTQAISFWLRNRQPQDWGNGSGNIPIHLVRKEGSDIKDVTPQVIVTIPSNGREAVLDSDVNNDSGEN